MTVRDAIPRSWIDHLTDGPIGVGMDIATTDGPTSNPASITVTQDAGGWFFERLVLSWKTRDEAVARAMLMTVFRDLAAVPRLHLRGCSIDASNEAFFAQGLARQCAQMLAALGISCSFQLVKGGESITFQGQTLRAKEMLGNLYVNAHTDGVIGSPEAAFIKEDRRLPQKSKGLFVTLTGKGGKHGDTFDSGKHAYWALLSGRGDVDAFALPIGGGSDRTPGEGGRPRVEDDDSPRTAALSC